MRYSIEFSMMWLKGLETKAEMVRSLQTEDAGEVALVRYVY